MKLIGAGLPRTATTTQLIALEMLGLPCYHMRDMMADLGDERPAVARGAGGRRPLGRALRRQGVDRRLARRVPLARADGRLPRRQGAAERPLGRELGREHAQHDRRDLVRREPHAPPRHGAALTSTRSTPRGSTCPPRHVGQGGHHGRRATATASRWPSASSRWNQEVIDTVPSERLLVWYPTDGWEPLCEFLEVDGSRRTGPERQRHRELPEEPHHGSRHRRDQRLVGGEPDGRASARPPGRLAGRPPSCGGRSRRHARRLPRTGPAGRSRVARSGDSLKVEVARAKQLVAARERSLQTENHRQRVCSDVLHAWGAIVLACFRSASSGSPRVASRRRQVRTTSS